MNRSRLSAADLLVALLAAMTWLGIGLVQRTRGSATLEAAVMAELPLTAAIFLLALFMRRMRRR